MSYLKRSISAMFYLSSGVIRRSSSGAKLNTGVYGFRGNTRVTTTDAWTFFACPVVSDRGRSTPGVVTER